MQIARTSLQDDSHCFSLGVAKSLKGNAQRLKHAVKYKRINQLDKMRNSWVEGGNIGSGNVDGAAVCRFEPVYMSQIEQKQAIVACANAIASGVH